MTFVKTSNAAAMILVGMLAAASVFAGETDTPAPPVRDPRPDSLGANTVGHRVVTPNELKWVDNPGIPGTKAVILFGDPKKSGPYTLRLKIPPHTHNPPHKHPDHRQVTVISGTWNFGHGDKLDPTMSKRLPAGTFFTEPAGSVHYNFTGSSEVVVQISGTGPTRTDYLGAKK